MNLGSQGRLVELGVSIPAFQLTLTSRIHKILEFSIYLQLYLIERRIDLQVYLT